MAKKLCSIFKNYIFWIVFIAILCVSLDVLFNFLVVKLWSFLIDEYIPSSFYYIKYLIIIILFFFNYFLLRHITISWIFEWQYPFQFFSMFKERQNYLNVLKMTLNNFTNAIDVLIDDFNSLPKIEIEYFEYFFNLFEEEYNIYHTLYTIVHSHNNNNNLIRYKMSKCQINYYTLLNEINMLINNNSLKNILTIKKKKKDDSNKDNNNIFINSNNNSNIENKKILMQLKSLLVRFHNIIDKYDISNYTFMSPAYLFNLFFNDTFGSLSLYSLQFKKNNENYQLEENFTPKGKIHYALIRRKSITNEIGKDNNEIKNNDLISENSSNNADDGILLIFCLPNGGIYELIPKSKIDFYMDRGFSFLCWNYNGYGYSKGSPSFKNIRTSVLELYDIIVHNPKYNFKKICVMGHSIGGVPAFYLAKNRNIDLIISDRNFCDLPRLVNNFLCGGILSFLLKCLFIGKTNNLENFDDINLKNTYKIIFFSPKDALILNDASVKSGISRYIIKNFIIYRNNENRIIKDKENILDIVFDKTEKERFLNIFLQMIHLYYEINNNNIGNKDETNSFSYYSMDKTDNFNFTLDKFLFSFFNKFYGCCCDDLSIFVNMKVSLRRQKIFIDNFFNNLIIWGVQSEMELLNFEFYSDKGVSTLKEASNSLDEFITNINQIDNLKKTLLKNNSENLKKIVKVVDNLDIIFTKNNNNNISYDIKDNDNVKENLISNNLKEVITVKNSGDEINKDDILITKNIFYDKLERIKGNIKILKINAGHNGWLNDEESEQYEKFLLYSRIID